MFSFGPLILSNGHELNVSLCISCIILIKFLLQIFIVRGKILWTQSVWICNRQARIHNQPIREFFGQFVGLLAILTCFGTNDVISRSIVWSGCSEAYVTKSSVLLNKL